MRYAMFVVMMLFVGFATPTWAGTKAAPAAPLSTPTFDDCYRLGWVRGVHVELGELPGWNDQCMAGKIPFDSGNPACGAGRNSCPLAPQWLHAALARQAFSADRAG